VKAFRKYFLKKRPKITKMIKNYLKLNNLLF
jgi:hypothetical protein